MSEDAREDLNEERREERRHARHALLQLIRSSGGEKTFARRDFSDDAFRNLAKLEADEIIEAVPCDDPTARAYRLKKNP